MLIDEEKIPGSGEDSHILQLNAEYGFACALDGCFAAYGKETYAGILKNALFGEGETLRLRGICLSAGLGPADNPRRDGSYAYYISEPVVENDAKGAAPLLMCRAELLRLSGSGREE